MVAKEATLRQKDLEANSKLSQMVEKQNEAEQRKAVAEQLTKVSFVSCYLSRFFFLFSLDFFHSLLSPSLNFPLFPSCYFSRL